MFVVGIGASAGGLEAIEKLVGSLLPDSGAAYVIVQHLSPDHKSLMKELLTKKTSLPIVLVEEGMELLPNRIHLISPRIQLTVHKGALQVRPQEEEGNIHLPIDIFFTSIAKEYGEKAVGIVLSGTGSDGMRGSREIKDKGGLILVQSIEEAKFDGMPKATLSTGLVDYSGNVTKLVEYLHRFIGFPQVAGERKAISPEEEKSAFSRILDLLKHHGGIDFTQYKPTTITRRIERRMLINGRDTLDEYCEDVKDKANELEILHRELLIGVTQFFRDSDMFAFLEQSVLPEQLKQHKGREFRVWIAGCSTGEEAYTYCMLLHDLFRKHNIDKAIRIFATDIDRHAISTAGYGIYPESIVADLSPAHLSRHFIKKEEGYQISRQVREMVVFAQHNLIKDPPFTNIDLISCRNLLIYFKASMQKKVMELFQFSLVSSGIMVLGNSETTGELGDQFMPLHNRFRIFKSRGRRYSGQYPLTLSSQDKQPAGYYPVRPFRTVSTAMDAEERLLERFLLAFAGEMYTTALVVNEQHELIHVLGDSTAFFQLPSGRLQNDVLKMARRHIQIPLSTGLQKLFQLQMPQIFHSIPITEGPLAGSSFWMRIAQVPTYNSGGLMAGVFVGLNAVVEDRSTTNRAFNMDDSVKEYIGNLEHDLNSTRESLQATIEELETSNEELQATNEELLASNEELQSTNEELQSTNEELHTVNSEYQARIGELIELSNDVDNLLANTQVSKVILDQDLCVRKFSPGVSEVFRILDGDTGRPLSHISNYLQDFDVFALVDRVRRTGMMQEGEAHHENGKVFLIRSFPYRLSIGTVEGVIITFIDITSAYRTSRSLIKLTHIYENLFNTMNQGVVFQNVKGQIEHMNPAAEHILGYSMSDLTGIKSQDSRWQAIHEDGSPFPGEDHPAMVALRTRQSVRNTIMGVFNPVLQETRWISIDALPVFSPEGNEKNKTDAELIGVYAWFEDITAKLKKN
jgi:two-component system, chemotaxis family, CheB/CheR fusion protein